MLSTDCFPVYNDIWVYRVFGKSSVRCIFSEKLIITLGLRGKKNGWKIYGSRCDEYRVDLHTMVFYTTHVTNLDGSTFVVFRPKLLYAGFLVVG